MSDNQRLNEIQARVDAKPGAQGMYSFHGSDVAYLLAELRKAHEALAQVGEIHEPIDALMYSGPHQRVVKVCTGCGTDDGNWQRWPCPTAAAVAAAKGDEA